MCFFVYLDGIIIDKILFVLGLVIIGCLMYDFFILDKYVVFIILYV